MLYCMGFLLTPRTGPRQFGTRLFFWYTVYMTHKLNIGGLGTKAHEKRKALADTSDTDQGGMVCGRCGGEDFNMRSDANLMIYTCKTCGNYYVGVFSVAL